MTYNPSEIFPDTKGEKLFELSNHLGNVLAVVSDKISAVSGSVVAFSAEVVHATDYDPFGMGMPGREFVGGYRYGFNSMAKDDEVKGSGNLYDYGDRMYDSRLGRWLSIDPLFAKYPGISPYANSANIPTVLSDKDGKDFRLKIVANESGGGGTITLQSTIFLYGPDASQDLADHANESIKGKNSVYNYIDAEGASWQVTMDIAYVYSPIMNEEGTKDDSDTRGTVNVLNLKEYDLEEACGPSLLEGIGYKPGDNFLYIDSSLPHAETIEGLTVWGTINGTVYQPAGAILVHESLHNCGFNDMLSSGIMGRTLGNITKSMYAAIGKTVEKRFKLDTGVSNVEIVRSDHQFEYGYNAESRKELMDEQKARANPIENEKNNSIDED